jgi:ABC-type multidrug transport system fused ATPase/permease subunit
MEAELDKFIMKKKDEDAEKKKEKEKELAKHADRLKAAGKDDSAKYDQQYDIMNFKIDSGGGNLSAGEKALICICRAILRRSKIIILDEATAAIDLKTEQFIEKLMTKAFKDSNMIVIAHRLQTIINSDKILVMGEGKKKEFGAPQKLLKNPKSHFSKLANKMQAEEEEKKKKKDDKKE